MGNRISTHISLHRNLEFKDYTLSTSQIITELLNTNFGNSYSGSPLIMSFNEETLGSEISYSEKWIPSGIFELMKNHPYYFEKAFVRFIDEMNDYDKFFEIPSNINLETVKSLSADCIYLFDKIEFSKFIGQDDVNLSIINNGNDIYSRMVKGKFKGRNEIPTQLENGINTYLLETSERISIFPLSELISNEAEFIQTVMEHSKSINFKFRNKTILKILNSELIPEFDSSLIKARLFFANKNNNGKIFINSCGWLNCGNKEYLNYKEERKKKIEELKKSNT